MLNLNRRNLLKLGIVVGGVVGVAGTSAWFGRDLIRKLQPGELVEHLKTNFDYLTFNIDDATFHEYVKDYQESYREIARESWYVFRGGDAQRHAKSMEHFTMTFLMSTDFFLNGANESKPVNYVMFYHPYRSPCWNPLSQA